MEPALHDAVVERDIQGARLELLNPEQARSFSVKQISYPVLFDAVGQPAPAGLYDPTLGPLDEMGSCETCGQAYTNCPGHFGHIELALPVYNPIMFDVTFRVLKTMCFACNDSLWGPVKMRLLEAQLKLLHHGLLVEADEIEMRTKQMVDGEDYTEKKIVEKIARFEEKKIRKRRSCRTSHTLARSQELIHRFFRERPQKCERCEVKATKLRKYKGGRIFAGIPKKKGQKQSSVLKEGAFARKESKDSESDDEISDEDGEKGQKDEERERASERFLTPLEAQRRLQLFHSHAKGVMMQLFGMPQWDITRLFYHVLLVTPIRFRPASVIGDRVSENLQTSTYLQILRYNTELLELVRGTQAAKPLDALLDTESTKGNELQSVLSAWSNLQYWVFLLCDSNVAQRGDTSVGVRQMLEKKEGLFRLNIMGKRVNYCARSVISPDVSLHTNEVGIPEHFAINLPIPTPVTALNVEEMRELVVRGSKEYPGAMYVDLKGRRINLANLSSMKREALSCRLLNGEDQPDASSTKNSITIVGRHLRTGDVVLLNRQPTLHKNSIMAHQVRVLRGEKTVRMHYANCNGYNADFDGDEMNIHVPQSIMAQAEAREIMLADNQYIIPTSGQPIRGLIQDHVVAGVLMTKKNSFFTKGEYMQLVFAALGDVLPSNTPIEPMEPCILRPVELWSGKQIISTILMHLTKDMPPFSFSSASKVPASAWNRPDMEEEANVRVRDACLLTGVLDKSQFGASKYGLVHTMHELYGAKVSGALLTSFGRVFTHLLSMQGFSAGLEDMLVDASGDERRSNILERTDPTGVKCAREVLGISVELGVEEVRCALEAMMYRDHGDHSERAKNQMDSQTIGAMSDIQSDVVKVCLPRGQVKSFPNNGMALMTKSGAKGSMVNHSQISCLLGQQRLEGGRVPRMATGRTLPCFAPYDLRPRAGGFIGDRFLTGIRPPEYYFHCMAGREGLVDTAVKTSRSGYLQRCLIKHLEGLVVRYDGTVREADGSVVQFRYGEDGLDVTQTSHLTKFDVLARNYPAVIRQIRPAAALATGAVESKKSKKLMKKALRFPEKHLPVLSLLDPSRNVGCVSESFETALNQYIDENPDQLLDDADGMVTKDKFRALMHLKYMRSIVQPGESVGLVAAQSLGEPSTQMTLNTFHFAGVGSAHVTAGIPRLREIIMTAARKIATPSMQMLLHGSEQDGAQLATRLSRIAFVNIIHKSDVREVVCYPFRRYRIVAEILPKELLASKYALGVSAVKKKVVLLVRLLCKMVDSASKAQQAGRSGVGAASKVATKHKEEVEGEEEGEEEEAQPMEEEEDVNSSSGEEEDDTGAVEQERKKRREGGSYEEEEGIEEEEVKQSEKEEEEDDEEEAPVVKKKGSSGTIGVVDYEMYMEKERLIIVMTVEVRDREKCIWRTQKDLSQQRLLMSEIVHRVYEAALVRAVPGISSAMVSKNEEDHLMVVTNGANVKEAWNIDPSIVHHDQLECNDIGVILETYGVEAARNVIVIELAKVFGLQGITVDRRHLSLIADVMTFGGGYSGFNRATMGRNLSPLLKMSFETTSKFIVDAAAWGEHDDLSSPSARITFGRAANMGTGMCELHHALEIE